MENRNKKINSTELHNTYLYCIFILNRVARNKIKSYCKILFSLVTCFKTQVYDRV